MRAHAPAAVSYAEAEGTETGDRYRVANDVANRFVRRLERWYVDGAPLAADPLTHQTIWRPAGPGFFRIEAVDTNGARTAAQVRVVN